MSTMINEDMLQESMEKKADQYLRVHENLFRDVACAPSFGGNRKFSKFDAFQLGEQLKQYKQYESWVMNEAGSSASDLGTLPTLATDLIAATYATSIAPLFCSLQNLEDQQGLIYYKSVVAGTTADGVTAGSEFVNALTGINADLSNYASEAVVGELVGTGNGTLKDFTYTIAQVPVRTNTQVKIYTGDNLATGIVDTQTGAIMSAGTVTGTLNFKTGALVLSFKTAPVNAVKIFVDYMSDFELAEDVPDVEMLLTSSLAIAEVLSLKMPMSTLKSFAFNKRFGKVADEEALADLTGALADVESRKVIAMYKKLAATNAGVTFSCEVPAGVSEFEASQAFRYTLIAADAQINKSAGRGVVNRLMGGYAFCQFVARLPGFTLAPNNQTVGPHVYGYLDGIPVVRTKYIETGVGYASYLNPSSPFEAPAVIGTYMPVFVTSTIQNGVNPLRSQRAIAAWKSFTPVVGQFVTKITLTNIPAGLNA